MEYVWGEGYGKLSFHRWVHIGRQADNNCALHELGFHPYRAAQFRNS